MRWLNEFLRKINARLEEKNRQRVLEVRRQIGEIDQKWPK